MKTKQKKTASSSFALSAFRFVGGGLVGSVVAAFLFESWEYDREQRAALQLLVLAWNGSHVGDHRDEITEWLLEPSGVALRQLPPEDHAQKVRMLGDDNPQLLVSVLAVTGFFPNHRDLYPRRPMRRALNHCSVRCLGT